MKTEEKSDGKVALGDMHRAARVGAGNDGKIGKARFSLIDWTFIGLMARQLEAGLHSGRDADGWKKLDSADVRDVYFDSLMRHVTAARRGRCALDPETSVPHWAGVAVNALILWWHERQSTYKDAQEPTQRSER